MQSEWLNLKIHGYYAELFLFECVATVKCKLLSWIIICSSVTNV